MRELFEFLSKFWIFIFLILLEIISLVLTFSDFNLYKNFYTEYAHNFIGKVYKIKTDILKYISLKDENIKLVKENAILRSQLLSSKISININNIKNSTTKYCQYYVYIPVRIINNSIYKHSNFLTIDKGKIDGIKINMGIILPNGIVGIITQTSSHFSTAISLLNTNIKINARLKDSKHFGTITWDGMDHNIVILKDIPKHVKLFLGQKIETDGKSFIFPEGIAIGKIKYFRLDKESSTYYIKIKLDADLSSVENAYVVKNIFQNELRQLNYMR